MKKRMNSIVILAGICISLVSCISLKKIAGVYGTNSADTGRFIDSLLILYPSGIFCAHYSKDQLSGENQSSVRKKSIYGVWNVGKRREIFLTAFKQPSNWDALEVLKIERSTTKNTTVKIIMTDTLFGNKPNLVTGVRDNANNFFSVNGNTNQVVIPQKISGFRLVGNPANGDYPYIEIRKGFYQIQIQVFPQYMAKEQYISGTYYFRYPLKYNGKNMLRIGDISLYRSGVHRPR